MTLTIVLAATALLVIADQLIKLWVLDTMAGNPSRLLIPHLLQITYVENRGAAFGILQGRVGALSIVTLVVVVTLLVLLIRGKFSKSKLVMWCIGLIAAGGLGNLIDRMTRGFVVDYLDISPLFTFPVFNLADCCVVVGTFLLMAYLLFVDGKRPKEKPVEGQAPDDGGTPAKDGESIG